MFPEGKPDRAWTGVERESVGAGGRRPGGTLVSLPRKPQPGLTQGQAGPSSRARSLLAPHLLPLYRI